MNPSSSAVAVLGHSEAASPIPVSIFPPEVWRTVFIHLDPPSVLVAAKVSRAWAALAIPLLWRTNVDLHNREIRSTFTRALQASEGGPPGGWDYPSFIKGKLIALLGPDLSSWDVMQSKAGREMRTLEFHAGGQTVGMVDLARDFVFMAVSQGISTMPKLTALIMPLRGNAARSRITLDAAALAAIRYSCPALQHLDVRGWPLASDNLVGILAGFEGLEIVEYGWRVAGNVRDEVEALWSAVVAGAGMRVQGVHTLVLEQEDDNILPFMIEPFQDITRLCVRQTNGCALSISSLGPYRMLPLLSLLGRLANLTMVQLSIFQPPQGYAEGAVDELLDDTIKDILAHTRVQAARFVAHGTRRRPVRSSAYHILQHLVNRATHDVTVEQVWVPHREGCGRCGDGNGDWVGEVHAGFGDRRATDKFRQMAGF